MRKKSRISFGPGAASLVLIAVMLSMSVLGILSLMNGRTDARFAERSAEVIQAGYQLNSQAEKRLAEIDAALAKAAETAQTDEAYLEAVASQLPEAVSLDGREISWTETDGVRSLDCAVEVQQLGSGRRMVWVRHNLTADIGEEW